jgi:serine/threonine protein kinase
MSETVCGGCGGVIDISGIEPFTLCECSDCGAELIIPLVLDFLNLERHLGRFSVFEVYEGIDLSLNSNSLIFILDQDVDKYDELLKIAKEEVSAVATIKHANVCPVANYGMVQDYFFIAEPIMDGFSLSAYAPDTQGLLDIDKVVDVLQAAALGLAVAHHKEFTHHNICADNIHIDARGNVRVKNYFYSRFLYQYEHLCERPSSVSPFYISPEKAESGLEDKRGDIFNFGVLFYFMLTGKYPFQGRNTMETVYSRVYKKKKTEAEIFNATENRVLTPETVEYIPPVAPHKIREELDIQLSNLIMRMLEYHPFKRPKMPEILDAINLYKAKEDQEHGVLAAQKTMVTTKTRAIPKMGNLSKVKLKEKNRRKKSFL